MKRIGALLATASLVIVAVPQLGVADPTLPSVVESDHRCGELDRPEEKDQLQGDVPRAHQESGRAEEGYNCGLALVGHEVLSFDGRSPTGNANMAWAGHCAYVAGSSAPFGPATPDDANGLAVVDVSDPANPNHVATLTTTAASTTLETLHAVDGDRAVLVVGQYGNQSGGNKPMDIYDVSDCANPRLLETFAWPENIHNLTISGNGRYVFATQPLQVLDIEPLFDDDDSTGARYVGNLEAEIEYPVVGVYPVADVDDRLPGVRGEDSYTSHEAWPTHDGTKLYLGGQLPTFDVFTIVDIADWLDGDGPPQVISQRNGRGHSVRTATIGERAFVLHSEESPLGMAYGCIHEAANPFAGPAEPWLTDVTDEADPQLVSQLGLEINQPEHCLAQLDSGTQASVHYHDVDDPDDTTFVMASMWNAGLRVFDVRTPERPVEVAYFNPGDVDPGEGTERVRLDEAWGHVRFVPETGHIWFATASGGFWVVELEPQVRQLLDLDDDGIPPLVRHPGGRPGTDGVLSSSSVALAPDVTPYYCTLGAGQYLTS